MDFVPDEFLDLVTFRETVNKMISVIKDSLCKIGCHADVERAIALAGENVNARLLPLHACIPV